MSLVLESTSCSQTDEVWSESSPAEKTEPDPLLGSQETQVKQMETTHVIIPPEGVKISRADGADLLSRLKAWARRWAVPNVVLNLLLFLLTIILIILLALPAKKCEPCPANPVYPVAACPEGWVGYLGKCYYFSEVEADWASSQSNCSAYNASLVGIDSVREMDFVMRYRGPDGYWIGLRREPGQPWKWTNGTEFNNWFPILGREECAFISHDIVSTNCSREGRWICSKCAEKTEGKAK
ncbi:C-type lectin domain family 2 member D-like [Emydura macquarii macquarii]|uniref:C-type lectin domain family 2 member D-like n=1 Tax=Emydura macquarii macquarii TaxID=1129001 RepID=UPI00352B4A57